MLVEVWTEMKATIHTGLVAYQTKHDSIYPPPRKVADILTLTRADKATSLEYVMQTIEAWSGEVFVVRVHLKAR